MEEPNLIKKALNLGTSLVRHASNGFKRTPQDEMDRRLGICNSCEKRKGDVCSVCGCPIIRKISMGSEKCPEGKW